MPEESNVKSGLGNRIPPDRLSDAAKARPNRIGSLYFAEPRKKLRTRRDTFSDLLSLIIALYSGRVIG